MAVPTIALYASPTSSVCSTPYPCHINAHASCDFELNTKTSTSASPTTSSTQKPAIGGLSCLFSSPSVKYAPSSSSYASCGEDLEKELSSSFCYSPSKFGGSSLKKEQSPVSVLQGPVSCSSSIGSRSCPIRVRDRGGDVNLSGFIRGGAGGLFNGFVRNALGFCIDHDLPGIDVDSCSSVIDELTFNMEDQDGIVDGDPEPYAKDLLMAAQMKHKIFGEDFVVKAFYEAEKAHRGQVNFQILIVL